MVAEAHGVWASGGDGAHWVQIYQLAGCISLTVPFNKEPRLRPNEARYLAKKLIHLADKIDPPPPKTESPQAVGGHARAAALSPEARTENARKAANSRWNKKEKSVASI